MKDQIAIAVFLVVCCIGTTLAGKCYQCNYEKDDGKVYKNWLFGYGNECGDNFRKSNVSTSSCSNDCYKAVVDLPDKNTYCISRGCFPHKNCEEIDANEKFLLECGGRAYQPELHCCKGGKCNGASGPVAMGLVTMVIGLMVVLLGANRW